MKRIFNKSARGCELRISSELRSILDEQRPRSENPSSFEPEPPRSMEPCNLPPLIAQELSGTFGICRVVTNPNTQKT